ncbi:MAG: glycosyltransferase family 2 protein [Polynucleobacter sp.]
MGNKVAIIIVNWNCWEDVARCINACGHLTNFTGSVIVVDNGSTDGSLQKLMRWVNQMEEVIPTSSDERIAPLELPSKNALTFIAMGNERELAIRIKEEGLHHRGIYFVDALINRGFGAGNNVGLRTSLQDPECKLFWCLNADAIPQPAALEALLLEANNIKEPCVIGSVLLNYDQPQTIQTIGSSFSRFSLKVGYQFVNQAVSILAQLPKTILVGYPIGASLALNRQFLTSLGLFDERYFLYYEEPDLVIRLPDSAFSFICTQSLVYHKGGQTTGGGNSVSDRGAQADYEFQRSRVILARKVGGLAILGCLLAALFSICRRLRRGRLDLAFAVVPAFIRGWTCDER